MASLPLELLLKLKDEASGALKNAKEAVGGLNLGAIALGGAAVAGVATLAKGLWDAAKAAGEEELGVQRLATTVKNTGADWGTAQTAIENYLAAETKRVALDDGEGRDSLNRLTAATGDYKMAMELLPGVMDLARGANISMEQATMLVTKAIDGSVGGLGKYGIEVSKDATETEILGAIQAKYAGQAEAYGNTFAGSQEKMDIALGNLKETIGAAVLPALTSLITTLADLATQALPYVEVAVGYLSDTIGAVMPVIVGAIQTAVGFIIPILDGLVKFIQDPGQTIFEAFKQTILTVMPIVQNAVAGAIEFVKSVLAGLQVFWGENGATIQATTSGIWNGIKLTVETVIGLVRGVINTAVALIHGDWTGAWTSIKSTLSTTWETIKDVVFGAVSGPGGVASILATAWGNIWNKAKSDWQTITGSIVGTVQGWVAPLTNAAGNIWSSLFGPDGAFTKMRDKLSHIFEGISIPLPHFSVKYMNVAGIQVPSGFDVQWYGQGGDFIARAPTLIGVGESGAERVTITPVGAGAGVSGLTLNFVYSPVMSLADESEAYAKIAPVLAEVMRREARRG